MIQIMILKILYYEKNISNIIDKSNPNLNSFNYFVSLFDLSMFVNTTYNDNDDDLGFFDGLTAKHKKMGYLFCYDYHIYFDYLHFIKFCM